MKKNNNNSLVKINNISTKKPVLSTPTKRTQTLVFFGFCLACFWERSLRLDTKKQLNLDSNFKGVTNNEGRLISTVLPHYFISNEQLFIVLIKKYSAKKNTD